MLKPIALIAALGLAGTAQAQTDASAPQTSPVPAEAAPPPAPRDHYSVDTTPIETLEADPEARAMVAEHFPSLFNHPAYSMFKAMTLKAIAPHSQGSINEETLAALQADLDALH